MMWWPALFALYVNGIVAGIQQQPVFWSEVACRAKMERVTLKGPDDPAAATYVKKRVYDRLIIDYHKLTTASESTKKSKREGDACRLVQEDARLVLDWLRRQQKVWGDRSESSLKELLEQLEQLYEVSWR